MAQARPRVSSRRTAAKPTKTYTYTVLIHHADPDESGYWVEVPALPGCFTQGETIEQCLCRAEEAIRCYVEGLIEDGQPVPGEPRRDGAIISEVKLDLPVSD